MTLSYKILIVDSCLENIQQLGRVIREGGDHVFVARGSLEAIDIAAHVDLDLILVSMDESREVLAGVAGWSVLPVLLTADGAGGDVVREFDSEISDLLDWRSEPDLMLARIVAYAELGRLRRAMLARQDALLSSHSLNDRTPERLLQFVGREADFRRELAGHVHEGPLQDLALASIQLKLVMESDADAVTRCELESAASVVDRANRSLRVHMADLGPQLLTDTGLDMAFESIVVQARARWEIPFEFTREGVLNDLPYLTQLLLLQSLWYLIRSTLSRPGVIAGDLFVQQFESILEVQVDLELDESGSLDGVEGGWESVDLHSLGERLQFVGAEVDVEVDGAILRANYSILERASG